MGPGTHSSRTRGSAGKLSCRTDDRQGGRAGRMRVQFDHSEYLADPEFPVDRWHQMESSANAKAIARLLHDCSDRRLESIVDPFAGCGSTAVAARMLGVPFGGIEWSAPEHCVSLTKATFTGTPAI